MASSYQLHKAAAEGFGNASAYDAHRPSYPTEAVEALLKHLKICDRPNLSLLEIASGTGKFTELLAARPENFNVVAVEPHDAMRATLEAKRLRDVQVRPGHAAKIPVEDSWADACIAAQSFHWFATQETLDEIHRAMKPAAVLGLIWNVEDYNKPKSWNASTSWEAKLNEWVRSVATDGVPRFRDEAWQAVFRDQLKSNPLQVLRDTLVNDLPKFSLPLGEGSVKWTVWLSEDALWARINTLSQVAVLEGEKREAGIRTFKEAMQGDDVERNEKGEVALHGVTYFAWTDRL